MEHGGIHKQTQENMRQLCLTQEYKPLRGWGVTGIIWDKFLLFATGTLSPACIHNKLTFTNVHNNAFEDKLEKISHNYSNYSAFL